MKRVLGVAALLLGVAGMSIGSAGLAAAQGSGGKAPKPHGNSGTVKIDQTPLVGEGLKDTANHPHIACEFTISFWGFDEGTHQTDVEFTAQPPSGHGQTVPALLSPTVFSFSGTEPGNSLDVQKTYKLDVTGLKANPHQGYHIKVETDLPGARELDKYKVFWYEPCVVPPPSTTTTTTTQPKETTTTEPPTTTTSTTSTTSTTLTPTSSTTPQQGTTTTSTTSTTLPGATTTTPTTSTGTGPATASTTTTTLAGATGQGSGSRSGLAFTSGPTPSGAGTDLGFFGGSNGNGTSDLAWILMIAGGALLVGAGTLTLNGNRVRRWMSRA